MAKHPRIEINPDVMVGKPVVRGTRVTVEIILRRFAEVYALNDILEDYPHLTADDVHAALAYAADAVARPPKPRGGELTTQGRDHRIRSKDTIPPGNDPNPPRDLEH